MASPTKKLPDQDLPGLLETQLSKIANNAKLNADEGVKRITEMIIQTFRAYTHADQATLFLLSARRRGELVDNWVEDIDEDSVIFRSTLGYSYSSGRVLDKLHPVGAGAEDVTEDEFLFEHIRRRAATDAVDVTHDARFKPVENKTDDIQWWRAIPLITTDRMIGIVILSLDKASAHENHFRSVDKDLLQLGGETAAEYLDAAFRQRNRETEHYILQKIAPLSKSDSILQNVCHELSSGVKKLRDTFDCTFFLRLENDQPYAVSWVDDEGDGVRGDHVFPTQPASSGIGVTGNVFAHGQSRIVYDSRDTLHEHDYVPAVTITPSAPESQSVTDPLSLLVVPVQVERRSIGVISVDSHEWANFNLYDRDLVESVANQIAALVDRAITFEAVQAITRSIANSVQLRDILHDIVTQAEKLTSATRGTIVREGTTIRVVMPPDGYPREKLDGPFEDYSPEGAEKVLYERVTELVWAERHIYNPNAVQLQQLFSDLGMKAGSEPLPITALIAAPIRDEGRFIGAFILTSALRERFTQLEVDAVGTFASLAGLAISNSQRLASAKENLDLLIEATRAGFGEMDGSSERSLNAIAEQARALVGATSCVIVRHDRDEQKLDFVAAAPYDVLKEIEKHDELKDIDLNAAKRGEKRIGLIGRIIHDRLADGIHVSDTNRISIDWPNYANDHVPFVYRGSSARSELAVPIINRQNEWVGAIEVEHRDANAFSQNDIVLVRAFADLIAIAFEPNAGIAVRTKRDLLADLLNTYINEQSNRGLRREDVVQNLIKSLYDNLAEQFGYTDIENIVVFPMRMRRTNEEGDSPIVDRPISIRKDRGYDSPEARKSGTTESVFRSARAEFFPDIQDYPNHNPRIKSRGVAVLPLSTKYQDVGVIWFEFSKRKTREFLEDRFFAQVAHLIALILSSWRPEDVTRFQPPATTQTYQSDIFVAFPFSKRDTLIPFLEDYARSHGLHLRHAASHASDQSTSFINLIWHLIHNCEVVIADCTELYSHGDQPQQRYSNPNVFYEIAIAHMIGKPVILITENGASSDVSDIAHLVYSLDRKEEFAAALDRQLEGYRLLAVSHKPTDKKG